jgi:carbamoyl-phosphate synthase large subunit
MKKILVCGAGGSPAINFIRSVRLMKEKVFLVGIDCNKYNLQRTETDIKLLVPKVSEPDYLEILNDIIREYEIEFMHIQNDKEIEFISSNREKVKTKLFLPKNETVEICLDKFKSYQAWKKAGILVPKTILVKNHNDLKKAFKKLGPKIWLRDIKGAAGQGSYPTDDFDEAVGWINFKKGWGHFTVAEYLSENSLTWMSIWYKGKLIVAQSRKRLYWEFSDRSPSGITGLTGTGVTFSDPKFDKLALRTIKAVDKNPHGIFSVDMTYNSKGIPNPTEINIGRFFTTHLFFSRAGLNMPEIFIKLAYGEKYPKPQKILNPLPDGLVWIRGLDFEPILATVDTVDKTEMELKKRKSKIKRI